MINLTTTQKVNLTILPEDVLGHVVPNTTITGVPMWNSSNVNVSSLVVAADGFSAYAFGTGAGSATINVIANAGTNAAPIQITGSVVVNVAQSGATQLAISASVISQ